MSTQGSGNRQVIPPTHQPDATLNQAAPVQNTWYTVLATSQNVRVIMIFFEVQTTGETIECELLIDGQTLTCTQPANADTGYTLIHNAGLANPTANTTGAQDTYRTFFLEGKSVRVRVRKTTANGAGNLLARVKYAKW